MTNPITDSALSALRSLLGIEDLLDEVRGLREELSRDVSPAWYNLKAACARKGCAYNTIKSNHTLQPNSGRPDGTIGGRRVWSRSTVEKWLRELDPPAKLQRRRTA